MPWMWIRKKSPLKRRSPSRRKGSQSQLLSEWEILHESLLLNLPFANLTCPSATAPSAQRRSHLVSLFLQTVHQGKRKTWAQSRLHRWNQKEKQHHQNHSSGHLPLQLRLPRTELLPWKPIRATKPQSLAKA